MKRLPRLVSAAVAAAAGLSAGAAFAVLRRLLDNPTVGLAAGTTPATTPAGAPVRISSGNAATGSLPVLRAGPDATPASVLPGWRQSLPVTPVPRDTVSATAAQEQGNPDERTSDTPGLPSRTWMVTNGSDWDGSPLELVVPPGRGGSHRMPEEGTSHP
ncbi:hypothetical protein [Arthrobacter gengyunqii]|uniref:Uncharacterized protein n=1 Tax=Arthrobacter gengyunqii TaxID=2886940 RepID=A0ABS8GK02_9MICC|nr:hypothetical protein [Arthrobacter gengyunqii]MCC3267007.1 hypothetical protein [Arthrobacter gengyunqii]